ncbi:hypothetical protein [Brachybacterium sp. J153]|uniref:hypothetical protein n=1 Tax=Brachybacterium sp. J153 TaxID=3116488 RepID=UPI002E79E3AF|nr:hypothetical protein [Brachybacterium sp. J153]MEE1619269.1 hypothetical protein [Brachybacterium sp. J153]
MTTLQQHVLDALLDRDPRQSEHRVKEAVAGALSTFDPSATLKITTYFNHTYAPDMMLSWGEVERPVFLRFTDNIPELGQDIAMLDRLDPLVFGLSTPNLSNVDENRLDEKSRSADVLLTTPAAVEELTERRVPAATDRMLRNSLAHAGRGALVATSDARALADTFTRGFTSAASGQVAETRETLSTIEHYFAAGQARRLNRVVQAVWEGGGSRLDQYPGDAELSTDVGSLPLLYLVQLMDTEDKSFWRGVGRNLTIEQLFDLARADLAMTDNFQHLVNANLDVLRARACQVLDMRLLDADEPPEFRWGVDLPVSEIPPALMLRGPGFHAFATRNRKEIGPRLKKAERGVSVHDYIERSQSASVAAVNVSVGGKRIALSDDSGTTDSEFLETATTGLPSAVVDRATVSTPTGRITVDFPYGTGIGVTRSDTLLAHILQTTTTLVVPMEPDAKERLDAFLAVAPQEGTLDEDEFGQFPIGELDDDED